jgi:hypothetical protein
VDKSRWNNGQKYRGWSYGGGSQMKYKITMKSGIVHEAEANNEMPALVKVWDKHYNCWTFETFFKQIVKIKRITE